ncbi:MAG: hypothetical protein FWC87_00020 [Acidimicrobiaceae bacterium]|nr:hypothetical protein [Acidimicrobiaceae bacterium]
MQKPGRAAIPPSTQAYTDQQVLDRLLRAPTAAERWTFELMDSTARVIGDLTPYVTYGNSTLQIDTTRDVVASLAVTLLGNPIDDMNSLIRPRYQLQMPDGGWIDFMLGLYNVLPAGRTINRGHTTTQVNCADSGQLLADAGIQYSMGIGKGQSYVQAITSVVETYGGRTPIEVEIPDSGKRLPAALSWNAGASRISIINDLLNAMNYYGAWFDERGHMRSGPIPDFETARPSAHFDSATDSIVYQTVTTTPDFSNVYNQFLLTCDHPQQSVESNATSAGTGFFAYYENRNPASPISVPRWHPKLKQWSDSTICDQATAYAACLTAAQVCERIFEPITFSTPAWPLSHCNDIYTLHILAEDEPDTDYRYIETGWSMALGTGQQTTHTFERISYEGVG